MHPSGSPEPPGDSPEPPGGSTRTQAGIEIRDDGQHEHGEVSGWSERVSFAFFDVASGFAGVARADVRPREGAADGSLHLFVPGGSIAAVLARGSAPGGGFGVGRLLLDPEEPLARWRIRCKDVALVLAGVGVAGLPASGQRTGSASRIDLDLSFHAWMRPVGSVERRTDLDEQHFARVVSSGHFEQAGRIAGRVRIGSEDVEIAGTGVRDRSWGPRNPTATYASRWFAIPFGEDLAIGVRAVTLGERTMRSGWVFREGAPRAISAVHAVSEYAGRYATHSSLALTDDTGDRYSLDGDTLATLPLKERGRRVNVALTRWQMGERDALGIAEYVDA